MDHLSLDDVLGPLSQAACESLLSRERGVQWMMARPQVVMTPGARVNIRGGIVVGKDMRGTVSDGSFVVDLGRGRFDAHDSVIVGSKVRVRSHGKTRVIGAGARVTAIEGRKAAETTTVVRKRKQVKGITVGRDSDAKPASSSPRIKAKPTSVKSQAGKRKIKSTI